MKLQDKETNEVIEVEVRQVNDKNLKDRPITTIDGEEITLEKLSKKYVDYEEPIEFWTIDIMRMEVVHIYEQGKFRYISNEQIANLEELGLKFETEEEANKAIEKLKAWKRVKDNRFERVFSLQLRDALCGGKTAEFKLLIDDKDLIEDIKLLFGGED